VQQQGGHKQKQLRPTRRVLALALLLTDVLVQGLAQLDQLPPRPALDAVPPAVTGGDWMLLNTPPWAVYVAPCHLHIAGERQV